MLTPTPRVMVAAVSVDRRRGTGSRGICDAFVVEATRVDQWLWAIRICKTRSQANALCRSGHVRVNGRPAKPATPVVVDDRVAAYLNGVHRDLQVVDPITKRVGAALAAACYIDHTPPPAADDAVGFALRERGSGRPTKKDRRQMDRLRGRSR